MKARVKRKVLRYVFSQFHLSDNFGNGYWALPLVRVIYTRALGNCNLHRRFYSLRKINILQIYFMDRFDFHGFSLILDNRSGYDCAALPGKL